MNTGHVTSLAVYVDNLGGDEPRLYALACCADHAQALCDQAAYDRSEDFPDAVPGYTDVVPAVDDPYCGVCGEPV